MEGVTYVSDPDGMLVSCVGSAGGRSGAEDAEEVVTEGESEMVSLRKQNQLSQLQNRNIIFNELW